MLHRRHPEPIKYEYGPQSRDRSRSPSPSRTRSRFRSRSRSRNRSRRTQSRPIHYEQEADNQASGEANPSNEQPYKSTSHFSITGSRDFVLGDVLGDSITVKEVNNHIYLSPPPSPQIPQTLQVPQPQSSPFPIALIAWMKATPFCQDANRISPLQYSQVDPEIMSKILFEIAPKIQLGMPSGDSLEDRAHRVDSMNSSTFVPPICPVCGEHDRRTPRSAAKKKEIKQD